MTGKKWTMVFGVIFLVLGLLGLIGGVGLVGTDGVFATNSAHDWVHIITGLIFILVAWKSAGSTSMLLKIFGVIYVLVAILGFVSSSGEVLGFLAVNSADNILHLILGIVMLAAGFMAGKQVAGGNMGNGAAV